MRAVSDNGTVGYPLPDAVRETVGSPVEGRGRGFVW
jgi:hypothetical protein